MAGMSPVGSRLQTALAWPDFLAAVDSVPPSDPILKETVEFLHAKCGFSSPAAAAGIEQSQLVAHEAYPTALTTRAFVARTLKAINAVYEQSLKPPPAPNFNAAASSGGSSTALSLPDEALRGQLSSVLGSSANAATLAAALAASSSDITTLLKSAQMEDLPFHLVPSAAVSASSRPRWRKPNRLPACPTSTLTLPRRRYCHCGCLRRQ